MSDGASDGLEGDLWGLQTRWWQNMDEIERKLNAMVKEDRELRDSWGSVVGAVSLKYRDTGEGWRAGGVGRWVG